MKRIYNWVILRDQGGKIFSTFQSDRGPIAVTAPSPTMGAHQFRLSAIKAAAKKNSSFEIRQMEKDQMFEWQLKGNSGVTILAGVNKFKTLKEAKKNIQEFGGNANRAKTLNYSDHKM